MTQSVMTRQLALRIGLAARALPGTSPEQLIQRLINLVNRPLTESKLDEISLEQYRQANPDSVTKTDLKASLSLLHGEGTSWPELTENEDQSDDLRYSIRVAVVSEDGIHVDGQFNLCRNFYIYQVSARARQLLEMRMVEVLEHARSEQKQNYRAELIQDCQVVYCLAIGASTAAKVIKRGVHPIKLQTPVMIDQIIEQLQHVLSTSPPPWLAKSMGLMPQPKAPAASLGERL